MPERECIICLHECKRKQGPSVFVFDKLGCFYVEHVVCEKFAQSQLNDVLTMPAQIFSQSIKAACSTVLLAKLRSEGIKVEL